MRRRLAGIVLFGALAAAAACGEPISSATPVPLGLLSVLTRSNADGQYVARPEAAFVYTTAGAPGDSRSTLDTCLLGVYDPSLQSPEQLDAGDSIVFTAGSETTILRPDNSFGIIRYIANPLEQPLVPGTSVSFTIPGALGGFPEGEIGSATPPAISSLTPRPAIPSSTDPLILNWEPVGDDSSRFEVLMLYASPGALDYDTQIVCDWRDDGSGTIRPEFLTGWAVSELRRVEVTRYRTRLEMIGDALLFLLTTFDTVPPIAP
jgi:hypothetical protein